MKLEFIIDGRTYKLELPAGDQPHARRELIIDGRRHEADVVPVEPGVYSILLNGHSIEATIADTGHVWVGSTRCAVEQRDPRRWSPGQALGVDHGNVTIKAAMPGKIVEILVKPGEMIETGQGLLVVEAMKMQNEVKTPRSGTVQTVQVEPGQSVSAGQALVIIE